MREASGDLDPQNKSTEGHTKKVQRTTEQERDERGASPTKQTNGGKNKRKKRERAARPKRKINYE
jgi:hypothetical protein